MSAKIIFLGPTGNKLHGINTKNNSENLISIFIPSQEQLLGISSYEQEYYKNSTHFISLPRFFKKISEDNLSSVEILFTPPSLIKYSTPEWELVCERAINCLGRSAAISFFDEADRLLDSLPSSQEVVEAFQISRIINNLPSELLNLPLNAICLEDKAGNLKLDQYLLSTFLNEADEQMVAIGGKQYLATTRVKTIRDKMRSVELRTASSQNPAENYDFSSIATAVRYADQGSQLIQQGRISIPSKQVDLLNQIMSGSLAKNNSNWIEDLKTKVKQSKSIISRKKLRDQTDTTLLNELCVAVLKTHINM